MFRFVKNVISASVIVIIDVCVCVKAIKKMKNEKLKNNKKKTALIIDHELDFTNNYYNIASRFSLHAQYRLNVSYHLLSRRVSPLSRRVSFLSRRVSFHSSRFSFLSSALQVPVLCTKPTFELKLVFPICILRGEIKK